MFLYDHKKVYKLKYRRLSSNCKALHDIRGYYHKFVFPTNTLYTLNTPVFSYSSQIFYTAVLITFTHLLAKSLNVKAMSPSIKVLSHAYLSYV